MKAFYLALLSFFSSLTLAADIETITPQRLLSAPPAEVLILDVRSAEEYQDGHVPGAINIPHDEITARIQSLMPNQDKPIVIYCRSGRRADLASSVLSSAGFTQLLQLQGHMNGWRDAQLPEE
jgi:phage shock protein E